MLRVSVTRLRRWAVGLVILVLAAVAPVVAFAGSAAACSCGPATADDVVDFMFGRGQVAMFYGEIASFSGDESAATAVFDVVRPIGGISSDQIVIEFEGLDSCSYVPDRIEPGRRVHSAVWFRDAWRPMACAGTFDLASVEVALARAPEAFSDRPAEFVISRGAGPPLAVLDALGQPVVFGGGVGVALDIAACPGSHHVVSVVAPSPLAPYFGQGPYRLELRTLPELSLVRSVPLPLAGQPQLAELRSPVVSELRCHDETAAAVSYLAADVVGTFPAENEVSNARVHVARRGAVAEVRIGPYRSFAASEDGSIGYVLSEDGRRIETWDLATAEIAMVDELPAGFIGAHVSATATGVRVLAASEALSRRISSMLAADSLLWGSPGDLSVTELGTAGAVASASAWEGGMVAVTCCEDPVVSFINAENEIVRQPRVEASQVAIGSQSMLVDNWSSLGVKPEMRGRAIPLGRLNGSRLMIALHPIDSGNGPTSIPQWAAPTIR